MSYIVELVAENVKRLRAVELHVDKGVITVGGRNAQGKTSLLDAVAMAIGGADLCPPEPVRRGANAGRVVVKLNDGMVAERTFSGGKSTLKVRNAEGVPVRSAQTMLDALISKISFDPLSFLRLDDKEQADRLRELAGADTTKQDNTIAKTTEDRKEVNREVKRLQGALEKTPTVEGSPTELVSVQELTAELGRRRRLNAAKAAKENEIDKIRNRKARQEQTIIELEKQLAELNAVLTKARADLEATKAEGKTAVGERDAMPVGDEADIVSKLTGIEEINAKVRAAAARKALADELEAKTEEALEMTKMIVAADEEKRKILADSKLPVAGLSFDVSGVRYNDVPFKQASAAERIRISASIGLAMNPKLKVLRIYDGSLLDADSMAVLAKLAAENEAQIWVEKVGADAEIVLEDGMVISEHGVAKAEMSTAKAEPGCNG